MHEQSRKMICQFCHNRGIDLSRKLRQREKKRFVYNSGSVDGKYSWRINQPQTRGKMLLFFGPSSRISFSSNPEENWTYESKHLVQCVLLEFSTCLSGLYRTEKEVKTFKATSCTDLFPTKYRAVIRYLLKTNQTCPRQRETLNASNTRRDDDCFNQTLTYLTTALRMAGWLAGWLAGCLPWRENWA